MTRNALVVALMSAGLYRGWWTLDDDDYATISTNFVIDAHEAWLDGLPPELVERRDIGGGKMVRRVKWVPESGDCDNIARDFGAYLSRCMWADAVRTGRPRGNVAAGKFNFCLTPTTGHAINWFCDHDGAAHTFDAGCEDGATFFDQLTAEQLTSIFEGESM